MELVGYEFDDQDRSGRFVVSKMPPELEKAGIKNARMRDAQTTEDMIPNNMPGNIGDYAHEKSTGKLVRIVDYTDDDEGIYTISYGEDQGETDVTAGDLEFVDPTVNQDLDDKILDKEIEEAPIEQDRDNPIAKPYVDTPEWKALHDMDDKIIDAYIKHKEVKEKAPPGREDQVKALKKKFKDKSAPYAIAWAQHNKHGKPKNEAELEEGKIKDWAKSLAMAGIFVAGLAGVGSINDAINNSVPAIKAMNNALEMAQDAGNDELVAQIEKDLKGAKLRLDIGRDLNQVKYLQDKYSKFMPTEGLAYESKLAILLNQRLK